MQEKKFRMVYIYIYIRKLCNNKVGIKKGFVI